MNESTKQEIKKTKKFKEKKLLRGEKVKVFGFHGEFIFLEQTGSYVACLTPSGTLAGFHIARIYR